MKIFKNKNILVTGGAGLIGSFMVDSLCRHGAHVTVIDNLSRGRIGYLENTLKQIKLIEADLLEASKVAEAFQGMDFVFHLASKVLGVGYSAFNQFEMLHYNDQITQAVLTYLDPKTLKHLLITSSSCVYDDRFPECIEPIKEFTGKPEAANEGYGWAKRFLEIKSAIWAEEHDIPLTIVRPFNIYGERYTWSGRYSQAIPMLVKKVLEDEKIEIWGSGNQRRNYIHASDCAQMMLDLVALGEKKLIINLGVQSTISLKELVEKMCRLYGREISILYRTDMPEGRLIKSTDDSVLFNYLPAYKDNLLDLDQGLLKMRDWYFRTQSLGLF